MTNDNLCMELAVALCVHGKRLEKRLEKGQRKVGRRQEERGTERVTITGEETL